MNRREAMGQARRGIPGLVACGVLAGCGVGVDEAALSPWTPEQIDSIIQATTSPLTPQEVAEAYALGSNATSLQRELLEQTLIGSVVEWDIEVYDVALVEGHYKVISEPIPIASAKAAELLRVVAFVEAQGEADEALLRAVRTGDVIRIRGRVREIQLRTMLVIWPGVVVSKVRDR